MNGQWFFVCLSVWVPTPHTQCAFIWKLLELLFLCCPRWSIVKQNDVRRVLHRLLRKLDGCFSILIQYIFLKICILYPFTINLILNVKQTFNMQCVFIFHHKRQTPASAAQLDAPSDWRPGGRGFNSRRGRQHSFVEIDQEIFSTVILPSADSRRAVVSF